MVTIDVSKIELKIIISEFCCISCNKSIKIDLANNDKTLGRIYSTQGLMEYKISRLCETCFDRITLEEYRDMPTSCRNCTYNTDYPCSFCSKELVEQIN